MHAMGRDVTETSPADWKYISEGGASIVFSYTGPQHPLFTGTVLRLRKGSRQSPPTNVPAPVAYEGEADRIQGNADDYTPRAEEPDDPTIAFQDKVISKLIPPEHLPRLQTAHVDHDWLEALHRLRENDRPMERRMRDKIDDNRCKAVLATDLVSGEGLAVEIKPKWGFFPSPHHLSSETREKKTSHCRFCMHSHYKSLRGTISSRGYCPLDLFSGDQDRVARSLRCLWTAWAESSGTVNNLRIFAQGELVDPDDKASVARLRAQLKAPTDTSNQDLLERFIEALLPLLLDTPLLGTLSHLQRTLDALDIEGLSSLWRRSYPDVALGSTLLDPTMEDWAVFVQTYLDSDTLPFEPPETLPDPTQLRYYCVAYLLSATFKDCSIILRLRQADKQPNTITAIDLDPKSVDRLVKWEQLDSLIVNSFSTLVDNCVDGRAP